LNIIISTYEMNKKYFVKCLGY